MFALKMFQRVLNKALNLKILQWNKYFNSNGKRLDLWYILVLIVRIHLCLAVEQENPDECNVTEYRLV